MANPNQPGDPTLLYAEIHSLVLTWEQPAVSDPVVTGYRVSYRTSEIPGTPVIPAGSYMNIDITGIDAGDRFVLANLQDMTSYDVRVRAVNDDGNGQWSTVVPFTTEEAEMAELNADLTRVSLGQQSTEDTLVPATRLLPFTEGSYMPIHERNNVDEMRGFMADYEDVLVGKATQCDLTFPLDFASIIPFLELSMADVTASGNPRSWAFTPGRTAPSSLAYATVELAATDGSSDTYNRRFGAARCTSLGIQIQDGYGEVSATLMGRASGVLASPANVGTNARSIIPVRLFKCYIDDTWATLGNTEVGFVRSATVDYQPGLNPAYNLQGRADLDLTGWYRRRFQGVLVLTVDHDGDSTSELAHFERGDLRFIRLEATSGDDVIRLDHCVRYIDTPDVLETDDKQHILNLSGQLRADNLAARNMLQVRVTNGLTAW